MDVVVTVPKSFGLDAWIAEGQLPGEPPNGQRYLFFLGRHQPQIKPGERVYVTYGGKLRGYAPLVNLWFCLTGAKQGQWALVREGGAVAVTIDATIPGFRGYRYRWWDYTDERPFPAWQVP